QLSARRFGSARLRLNRPSRKERIGSTLLRAKVAEAPSVLWAQSAGEKLIENDALDGGWKHVARVRSAKVQEIMHQQGCDGGAQNDDEELRDFAHGAGLRDRGLAGQASWSKGFVERA